MLGALIRQPLASVIGTPEHPWGAAAIPITGALWLLISLQRGVLLGLQAFRPVGVSIVGEAGGRLIIGGALAAAAGVTGAFLGRRSPSWPSRSGSRWPSSAASAPRRRARTTSSAGCSRRAGSRSSGWASWPCCRTST